MSNRVKVYRAHDGVFFGVCKGVADAFDFDLFVVRLTVVAFFFFSGFWPVACVYLVAAFFLKPDPLYHSDTKTQNFSEDLKKSAARKVKSKFSDLEQRVRILENEVTNREYDWERRFYSQK